MDKTEVPQIKYITVQIWDTKSKSRELCKLFIPEQENITGLQAVEDDPAYDLASLAVETGISDLAAQHDYYLYGTRKRGV
jgi:hypothetical protein